MFTPERMSELTLFIYEESIEAVMLELARLGALQIEDETGAAAEANQSRWASTAAMYAAQEQRLRKLLDALGAPISSSDAPTGIDLANDHKRINDVLAQAEPLVEAWQRSGADVKEEIERLHFLIEQMRLLAPLDVPVERLTDMHSLHLVVGTMPSANLARIQTALFRIPFVIIPAHTYAARTLVFAATPTAYGPILDRGLRSAFFQPIPLPGGVSGSPGKVLVEFERQRADALALQKDVEDQGRRLASEWGESLVAALHRAQVCRVLVETIQRLPVQGQVYVVAGWAPAGRVSEIIDRVQEVTNSRAIIEVLEPDADRRHVPTKLQHPHLMRGFESLVQNYGVPGYHELDPTLFFASAFVLMFGIMFGDVGHGLLLALTGLWLSRRQGGLASLSTVLVACGLSACMFGFLYGSVLGMPLLPAIWMRPAENIMGILLATLVAGIVLLNFGFVLSLYTSWRVHNWAGFLLEANGLAGAFLYWALLGGGLALYRGVLSAGGWFFLVLIPALALFLREPLLRWRTEGRFSPHGSWGEYAVLAFFELFEAVISFLGNSLSFVRLGAFAVAHEGISHIVLQMAQMSPSWGWLIMAFGTVFIVGFEGLIVGIQTLRLEYYEFFGKFFRGDGSLFKPLRMPRIEPT